MASTLVEKRPLSNVGSEFRTMKSILCNSNVLLESAPKLKLLPLLRKNDDIVLLFQRDQKIEDYKYITGKADGKTYVGIMPFDADRPSGTVKHHEEIVNAVQSQFNVTLTEIKGGWAQIDDDSVFFHDRSAKYRESDHEKVMTAIMRLVPEMDSFKLVIGFQ